MTPVDAECRFGYKRDSGIRFIRWEESAMNPHPAPGRANADTASAADLLDSWKAIAQYLNKDIRTLQRWESDRNMPVHRIPGGDRPSVYALKSELNVWRGGRDIRVATGD